MAQPCYYHDRSSWPLQNSNDQLQSSNQWWTHVTPVGWHARKAPGSSHPSPSSCCDKTSDKRDSGKGGFILTYSSGHIVHHDCGSMARHSEPAARKQVRINARAQLAFSFTQFKTQPLDAAGWVLLSQNFFLTTSWTYPKVCFHGDSKCSQADNEDGPSSLSKFSLWLLTE